jgi:sporulation protein YlmC with PRC-barrel domain
MKLSDILGETVMGPRGRELGRVLDVRLVQDGPLLGSFGAMFRIDSLVVGRHTFGARLGYDRGDVRGPAALRWAFRAWHRDTRSVHWSDVRAVEPTTLHVADPKDWIEQDHPPRGRSIDAGLHLLDRQLIDIDGLMAGKVDDLRFTFSEDPGQRTAPHLSAIMMGPGALAQRIGGHPGRWLASLHARLSDPEAAGPDEVSFGVVQELGDHLQLSVSRGDLPVTRFENWVRDRIIGRIPGS